MNKLEYKSVPFEITAIDYEGRTIEGYASTYIEDFKGDVVHPGAFKKSLQERGDKIRFLWQHDIREPIGKFLELREDAKGLWFKAIISDTSRGRDALALFKDGAIDEFSIGFDSIPDKTSFERKADGSRLRHLKEVRLWCISAVTFAMNEGAVVTAIKSIEGVDSGDVVATVQLSSDRYEDVTLQVDLIPLWPDETKKYDENDNSVRISVRDEGDFQEGTYKTITISKKDGIKALIGKLKGKSSTAIKTYIFSKSNAWTMEKAKKWVTDNKKSLDFTALCENVRTVFHYSFDNYWEYQVGNIREGDFIISKLERDTGTHLLYLVPYKHDEFGEMIEIAPKEEWKRVRVALEEVPESEEQPEAKSADTTAFEQQYIEFHQRKLQLLGQAVA